jgi:hypothetical protein
MVASRVTTQMSSSNLISGVLYYNVLLIREATAEMKGTSKIPPQDTEY